MPRPPSRRPPLARIASTGSRAALGAPPGRLRAPRPAGSKASRRLAKRLRDALPNGRYQSVPGGLRNVIGTAPGRDPKRLVVVGAHYDTKDIPDFVGAIDGASGTAVVTQLARTIKPRTVRPTLVFVLFDGEESPAGTPDSQFERYGLRGSKVAARTYRRAESMILLDFVGEKELTHSARGELGPGAVAQAARGGRQGGRDRPLPERPISARSRTTTSRSSAAESRP